VSSNAVKAAKSVAGYTVIEEGEENNLEGRNLMYDVIKEDIFIPKSSRTAVATVSDA